MVVMPLTATVLNVMTVYKPLTGVPIADIVLFRYCGYRYYVETAVDMFRVDDIVEVSASCHDGNTMPQEIQLIVS